MSIVLTSLNRQLPPPPRKAASRYCIAPVCSANYCVQFGDAAMAKRFSVHVCMYQSHHEKGSVRVLLDARRCEDAVGAASVQQPFQ